MNEQNIPIDIHTNKLLDWLISRRHCKKDWQKDVLPIREKINNAIQDMPVHDGILRLLSGTYINYFHCLKIIDILKETEADTKNLFGRYGSQRMRDWQEVVRLYEKDNIYLAEAAQMLTRNVNYEIPSIRKQIAKLEQMQTECDKREKEYAKTERVIRAEFAAACKNLGIPGQRIKHELVDMLSELPGLYRAAAESVTFVAPAIELYKDFLVFISASDTSQNCIPLLEFVIEHGNTTTYEWTYGEAPVTIEEPPLNITLNNTNFGHGDGSVNIGDDIDFGSVDDNNIVLGDVVLEEGEIDWGADPTESEDTTDIIDFEIGLEESGIVVEDAGIEGGVARGNDAFTLLDNPNTRGRFIDALMELESFLKMRLYELSNSTSLDALTLMQATGSTVIQTQTPESVASLLSSVQGALASVSNSKIQHLHSVKHSPRYVDYLADSLQQKLNATEKTTAQQESVRQRREEAIEQAINLGPVLQRIIEKTKEMQEQIEEDISKKYKNRPVNLMGGVNSL